MTSPGTGSAPGGLVERLRAAYERAAWPPEASQPVVRPVRPLAADGVFVTGTNLPWVIYGCDVGASAWRPQGGVGAPRERSELRDTLSVLADRGTTLVRWFLFGDGRSGVRTVRGVPSGLDDAARHDLDAAGQELERAGMSAVFVLFDYLLCAPAQIVSGVQLGGRRDWLRRARDRAALIEGVLVPTVHHFGATGPVAAWDLLNEPEWVTYGFGGRRATGAVSRRTMQTFLVEAALAAAEAAPQPITVGLASARSLELVAEVGLDFYQVHWYDHLEPAAPLDLPVTHWRADRPVLLGEYPTRGSRRSPADIEATARRGGYAGAFSWSARSKDPASSGTARV